MNRREMLLQILQEEAAEVIQAASKINRFGVDGNYPNGIGNVEQLLIELTDMEALIMMTMHELAFSRQDHILLRGTADISRKIDKVEEYLKFSKKIGTLSE